jgi:WD40 repeat protein
LSNSHVRFAVLGMSALLLTGALFVRAGEESVTRVTTSKGTLVIITDDPEVDVLVKQGGQIVTIFDPKSKKQLELKAGDYEIRLTEGDNALSLATDQFTLRRGEKTIVRVHRLKPHEDKPAVVVQKAEEVRRIEWGDAHVYNTTFSPDGRFYLAGGDNNTLRLYEVESGKQIHELEGHGGWTQHAVFTPNGKHILSASTDKTVRLWDVTTGKEVRKFEGHEDGLIGVDVTADGKWALSGGADKTLRLWDVATGKEVRKFEGHGEGCCGIFSADGKQVLSWSGDKTLRLWDVESGKEVRKIEAHTEAVYGAFLLPGGKQALSYSADKTVRVWDLGTGKEVSKIEVGDNLSDIRGVALSPDGKRILVGDDGTPVVRLLDLATGKEIHRFEMGGKPRGLSFSPDGRLAAGGSFRGFVYLWRVPGTFPVEKPSVRRRVELEQ